MVSNHGATIGLLGSKLNNPDTSSVHEHVIHGKPFADNGIFFNTGESAGKKGEYATQTTKDEIGKGSLEACKHFYDVAHGGGFYEGIKQPKYGTNINNPKICKPTAFGILNFPPTQEKEPTYMVSEAAAGFNQYISKPSNTQHTVEKKWNDFLISKYFKHVQEI